MRFRSFLPLEWTLALRYLSLRRKDSFISVVAGFAFFGIVLSVATLIVVMSVMNGFREQLLGRILGMNGHVGVYYTSSSFNEETTEKGAINSASKHKKEDPQTTVWQKHLEAIEAIPSVKQVFPLVEQQAIVMHEGRARGGVVHGVLAEALLRRPALKESIIQGEVSQFKGRVVFLGERLAQRLGVFVGDDITLGSPAPLETALGSIPHFGRFRVKGIFHFGMNEYDQTFIFMPLDTAQQFFNFGRGLSGFEVFVKDPENLEDVTTSLKALKNTYHFQILDWRAANQSFFSVIEVERNVMFLILMLMVLVSGFNIVSGLVMLIKDKSRDIAILRAMGAGRAMVGRLFLWVGLMIGGCGALVGVMLGLGVAYNLEPIRLFLENITGARLFPAEFYFLSKMPSKVSGADVWSVLVLTFVLALVAAFYPARRAARLMPHRVLRFE